MHTIARSQTAIRFLDQALHMVSEFEDTKTSHDKWFDRATYKTNSSNTLEHASWNKHTSHTPWKT